MKKLLLINSRFLPLIGGGETYTIELMQYFVQKGWEVHLVTQERGFGHPTWSGCKIHYIDGFDDNDLHVHTCAPQLRKVLDSVKPDLVHVHNIMPYFIYASLVDPHEFSTVLTIHNTPDIPRRIFGSFHDFKSERMFTRQLLANRRHDKVLVGSKYYLDSYSEVAPWIRSNSDVAYYFPPDVTTGPLVAKAMNTHDEVRLLFPSRILRRKGIEECIRALAKLPAQFTLSLPSFAHAEDAAYRLEIRELIDELELQGRVFTPSVVTTPEMMRAFYASADMVVIPSHYEGFGIVAVEAMSWGVPVIASAVGGLGEIVQDHVNGITVRPQCADDIVAAVLAIEGDKELAGKLVHNAIETVNSTFNRTTHMHQIEVVYKESLDRKQGVKHHESRKMAVR